MRSSVNLYGTTGLASGFTLQKVPPTLRWGRAGVESLNAAHTIFLNQFLILYIQY